MQGGGEDCCRAGRCRVYAAAVLKAAGGAKGVAGAGALADVVAAAVADAQEPADGRFTDDPVGEAALPFCSDNVVQHHPPVRCNAPDRCRLWRISSVPKPAIPAEAANSVGAYIAGAVPHKGALDGTARAWP